ncbi:hypothetical protein D3C84_658810 [compost metagenome]
MHLRHHHLRHHRHLRSSRADNGRQHHIGDDVDVGQAAADGAEKDRGKGHQPLGYAPLIHQLPHQHEQRNRQQTVVIQPTEELLRIGEKQHAIATQLDIGHSGDRQYQRDGQADEQQHDKNSRGHGSLSGIGTNCVLRELRLSGGQRLQQIGQGVHTAGQRHQRQNQPEPDLGNTQGRSGFLVDEIE